MIKHTLILLTIVITMSCGWREEQTRRILSKKHVREDLFEAVIKDSTYLSELMTKAVKNKQAQELLKKNDSLAKLLCTSVALDRLIHQDVEVSRFLAIRMVHHMEEDTASCQLMCGMVMENPVLRRHLKANICPELLSTAQKSK